MTRWRKELLKEMKRIHEMIMMDSDMVIRRFGGSMKDAYHKAWDELARLSARRWDFRSKHSPLHTGGLDKLEEKVALKVETGRAYERVNGAWVKSI